MKKKLTLSQLSKIVYIFSKNLHDITLPFSLKIASVRLIINLHEEVNRKEDEHDKGRSLLCRILSTFVDKVFISSHLILRPSCLRCSSSPFTCFGVWSFVKMSGLSPLPKCRRKFLHWHSHTPPPPLLSLAEIRQICGLTATNLRLCLSIVYSQGWALGPTANEIWLWNLFVETKLKRSYNA